MPDYLALFEAEDQQRVFRFLALFSWWECALKRSQFVKAGAYGQAEADWSLFADRVAHALGGIQAEGYTASCNYLLNSPPLRTSTRRAG